MAVEETPPWSHILRPQAVQQALRASGVRPVDAAEAAAGRLDVATVKVRC